MKKKAVAPASVEAPPAQTDMGELKDLMTRSIQWSEAVYKQNKKIHSHLRWISIFGAFRVFIILIPIIIGIIYLPPLFSQIWAQYQSILGVGGAIPVDTDTLKEMIDQLGGGIDVKDVLNKFSGE